MRVEEFLKTRKVGWEALDKLLQKGQYQPASLSPADIQKLGQYYRAVTSDLALARRDFPNHPVVTYLNQLVARAHAFIYRSEPLAMVRLKRFVLYGFPQVFRQTLPFTLTALFLFLVPALLVGGVIFVWPQSAYALLPQSVHEMIPMLEQQTLWTNIPVAERPYASSFIMRNNIQVSFLAFASGVTGGLLTLWILVMNGLILGGLLGLASHYGVGFDLATFVIGHGVIELSVIFMAGGSGLMLGWALLRPGLLRRRDALAVAAQKSVRLLLGAVPWLVVAGVIEGFLSPHEGFPWFLKWGVGVLSGVLFYGYLLWGMRARSA
ncbi:MAG: stage II sporulation protein M [Chloroflexota bacterium]